MADLGEIVPIAAAAIGAIAGYFWMGVAGAIAGAIIGAIVGAIVGRIADL